MARSHTLKSSVFHQYLIATVIAYSFSIISVLNKAKWEIRYIRIIEMKEGRYPKNELYLRALSV